MGTDNPLSSLQRVDLNKIRQFADSAEEALPQIRELCDLVEAHGLLEDVAQARLDSEVEAMLADVPAGPEDPDEA